MDDMNTVRDFASGAWSSGLIIGLAFLVADSPMWPVFIPWVFLWFVVWLFAKIIK